MLRTFVPIFTTNDEPLIFKFLISITLSPSANTFPLASFQTFGQSSSSYPDEHFQFVGCNSGAYCTDLTRMTAQYARWLLRPKNSRFPHIFRFKFHPPDTVNLTFDTTILNEPDTKNLGRHVYAAACFRLDILTNNDHTIAIGQSHTIAVSNEARVLVALNHTWGGRTRSSTSKQILRLINTQHAASASSENASRSASLMEARVELSMAL